MKGGFKMIIEKIMRSSSSILVRFVFSVLAVVIVHQTQGQQISGSVLDMTTNQPVVGALISNSNTGQAVSDKQGKYTITLNGESDSINISHVNYVTVDMLAVSGKENIYYLVPTQYQLSEVVVNGYQSDQSIKLADGGIALLGEHEFAQTDGTNLSTSLNKIPGLYMHSGTYSTNRITMRGIGARSQYATSKIKAYFNNIPLTSGDGISTLEDIDVNVLNRIVVLKGPSSSIYGAGLGGTILMESGLLTKTPSNVSVGTLIGAYGLVKNTAQGNYSSDKISVYGAYNGTNTDGYRDNSEYNRQSYTGIIQSQIAPSHTLSAVIDYADVLGQIPSSLDSAKYWGTPTAAGGTWGINKGYEDYKRLLAGINHAWQIGEKSNLATSIYSSSRNAFELRPFNDLEEKSNAMGLRTVSSTELTDQIAIKLGLEYFNEKYDWSTKKYTDTDSVKILSDLSEVRKNLNLFAQVNFTLSSGTNISAGLNLNTTNYELVDHIAGAVNQSGEYSYEPQWSPRVAINQSIGKNIAAYASVSHGFSPPTLEETLTPEGLVNTEIRPEQGFNYEAGIRGNVLDNKTFFDVSVYTMKVKDLLVARRVGQDEYIGVNAGKTTHSGLDVTAYHDILKGGNQSPVSLLRFQTTYAYADYVFDDFIDEGNDYSGNAMTGIPVHKFTSSILLQTKWGIGASISYDAVSEMPITDDNALYSDAYQIANIKLSYNKVYWDHFKFETSFGINNVLDEKYASMILINANGFGGRAPRYYYPGLPLNYYGSLTIGYKF